MLKNLILLLISGMFFPTILSAQLSGKVIDEKGEPMPFASVYLQGTTHGTTTNPDGYYSLDLKDGNYKVVFQYVGYQQHIENVVIKGKSVQLNITLQPSDIEIQEFVVHANAEDPAYAIIRRAIEKRKYFRDLVKSYSCDVYIKGNYRLTDAPKKIFGQEVGNMGGMLDSTGNGIIYLSESISKLYFQEPNNKKEVMISSKVSGDENGFSINRASLTNLNFYENHTEIFRDIISPIATNALLYYKYKLIGTSKDDQGRNIKKIEVIPIRNEDPVYRGMIYIVEDVWNIHSLDLMLIGASVQNPILDTLWIKQINVPVEEPDTWRMLNQSIVFKFKVFSFKIKGNYTSALTNYVLNPTFDKNFFSNEVIKIEEGSNKKDSVYWNTVRPVPLTDEEKNDYVKKDSLQVIWKSKSFLDSMDHVSNKFELADLLFGYSYDRSYDRWGLSIGSPLKTVLYNTVQGFSGTIDFTFKKSFDEDGYKRLLIDPFICYSWSDDQLRWQFKASYRFNAVYYPELTVLFGRNTAQFNPENPISPMLNSAYRLVDRKNYLKIYDKTFGAMRFRRVLFNGYFINTGIEAAQRDPLINHSDYSFWAKNKKYTSNDPLHPDNNGISFFSSNALVWDLTLLYQPGQKYASYPNHRESEGSNWPSFFLNYRKAIPVGNFDIDYDYAGLKVKMYRIKMGLVGFSSFNLEGGMFLRKKNLQFIDYRHFNGNRLAIANPNHYLESFKMLPYYTYSTTEPFGEGHYEHNFRGFIFDKIPLIRKLGLQEIIGVNFLYTKEQKDYWELSFGLDNIGFGVFRLFRVDVVSSFVRGKYHDTGVVFGIRL